MEQEITIPQVLEVRYYTNMLLEKINYDGLNAERLARQLLNYMSDYAVGDFMNKHGYLDEDNES